MRVHKFFVQRNSDEGNRPSNAAPATTTTVYPYPSTSPPSSISTTTSEIVPSTTASAKADADVIAQLQTQIDAIRSGRIALSERVVGLEERVDSLMAKSKTRSNLTFMDKAFIFLLILAVQFAFQFTNMTILPKHFSEQ